MSSWLVFIESNTSGTGPLFWRAARELGHTPIMLTRDASRYPALARDGVAHAVVDTDRAEAIRDAAAALARQRPIAGVLSSSEYFVAAAATLARDLGLPGLDPTAASRCRDKGAQRDAMRRAGLAMPASRRVSDARQCRDAAIAIGLPIVIKPVDGTGSIGVRLCETLADVDAHAARLLTRQRDERGRLTAGELLVEQYVSGDEYSAEMFGEELIGITAKHLSPPPSFVEVGHDYPADVPSSLRDVIAGEMRRAVRALGLGWGPSHIEFRIAPSGPIVIEVNARLAGGFIPELVRAAHGIDLIAALVSLAAGARPDLAVRAAGAASIRFLTTSEEGWIERIDGIDEAARMDGLLDVRTYRQAGDRIERHHDFRDRLGHVIARASTSAISADRARRARDRLRITVGQQPARTSDHTAGLSGVV